MQPMDQGVLDTFIRFLLNLTHHTEIVDHVPGRITLSFSLSGLGLLLEEGAGLTGMIDAIPGLKGYNLSMLWRSVVIDYDPKLLPDDLWSDLQELKKEPALEASVVKRLETIFNGKHKLPPAIR